MGAFRKKLQRVFVPESLSPVRPESQAVESPAVDSLGLELSEDEIESQTGTQKRSRDKRASSIGAAAAAKHAKQAKHGSGTAAAKPQAAGG